MPCNCDYMEADNLEKELSKVACLLDELRGRKINDTYWDGYHPIVYNKATKQLGDKLVAELCSKLQDVDIVKCSFEMQIWWRDHQIADKKRLRRELKEKNLTINKEKALAKLTKYEKKLLGLR